MGQSKGNILSFQNFKDHDGFISNIKNSENVSDKRINSVLILLQTEGSSSRQFSIQIHKLIIFISFRDFGYISVCIYRINLAVS